LKFEIEAVEEELNRLCSYYQVPQSKRPELEFFHRRRLTDDYVGFYNKTFNEIWIFEYLDPEEALLTVRHEFGHFLLCLRDPKRKFHKGEERIARMMERTLLRFPHLIKTRQQPLDVFASYGSKPHGETS